MSSDAPLMKPEKKGDLQSSKESKTSLSKREDDKSPLAKAGKGGALEKGDAPKKDPDELSRLKGTMTIWEHMDELRRRLVWSVVFFIGGMFAAWSIKEIILAELAKPFHDAWVAQGLAGAGDLHFSAPGAAFLAYMKLSMIGGGILAAPFISYEIWAFIAPALYRREKRYVIPFVLCSSVLFVGGGYFGWRMAFPVTFNYFLSMSGAVGAEGLTITPTVMMDEYIDFSTQLLLGFGVVFEMPLVILFLSVLGVVDYIKLIKFGRWFILIAFTVAAILTPPDVTSQMVMGIPMVLLYGLSIGLAFIFGKRPKKKKPGEEDETESDDDDDDAKKAAAE